ncbi:MAG: hypothetical protein HFJ86_04875 [Oscillospiraceae bacterium]|jgi:hypothetical protein|nr:hypothetical protein [Oscillospiraceae bacterium]
MKRLTAAALCMLCLSGCGLSRRENTLHLLQAQVEVLKLENLALEERLLRLEQRLQSLETPKTE